ncbi:GDSL-type esterase/lipase family protein [Stieleria sp. TO1_6]|uniref:SGNH/GDSL hydrolase family protein n=1 Tax=Stieleria tagensis TaxID=2956795 RepID=UPI00209B9BF1|nr:GDSL-type esterase/lipase family protein [Stieleria tagensis]MCO8120374.1 GDSL-type esterase/lipase family protein [Stieleria tagensis]
MERKSKAAAPPNARPKLSWGRKLTFAVLTGVLFFVVVEGLLRVSGFQVVSDVQQMQFTFPIDDYNNNAPEPFLRRDRELFWTPRPGVVGHNSMGFYGPEFSQVKPEDVFRIVCLGDSCTHFGPQSYPEITQSLLRERLENDRIEVINAGVIGYTSYQGLTLMRTRVPRWQPDVVTVYFGWNDHWLSRGLEDKDQTGASPSSIDTLLGGLRSVQLAEMLTRGWRAGGSVPVRVSLQDYRENLIAIADQCDAIGSETVFLTAPHAMDLSIPEYLLTSGEVADASQLIPLHQSYNAVVREVAAETDSGLIDLAAQIDQVDKLPLFIDDHIHLTLAGRQYVAEQIAGQVAAEAIEQASAQREQ